MDRSFERVLRNVLGVGRRGRGGVPLGIFLRRHRRWRLTAWVVTVAVLIVLSIADHRGLLLYDGGDVGRYDGQWFRVVHVVDGDTLDVAVPDGDKPTTRIRLWGINAPEMPHPWLHQPGQPFAHRATDLARALAMGQVVGLRLQTHRLRGSYGRLLAFVELPDGTVLNDRVLAVGLARNDPRWRHDRLARYARLEASAKAHRLGLWSGGSGRTAKKK